MKLDRLVLPFVSFALATSVHGATQTFSDTIAFTWTNNLGSNELSLSQFDASQGTLEAVELTITYNVPEQDLELDNDADGGATGNFNFGEFGSGDFSSSAGTAESFEVGAVTAGDFDYATQSASYNLTASTGDDTSVFNTRPGESDYFIFQTSEAVYTVTRDVNETFFDDWEGASDVTIDLAKSYASNISDNVLNGSGTLRQSSTQTTGDFSAEVTYTYTPVPEVSAFSLLTGFGALALVAVRRRR